MANLKVLDGSEAIKYVKGDGAGTDIDPLILSRSFVGYGMKGVSRKTMAGSAQSVTIPSGSKYAEIQAEGGDIRAAVDAAATATSEILAVEDLLIRRIWLVGNTSLSVYGVTGAYANIVFYG